MVRTLEYRVTHHGARTLPCAENDGIGFGKASKRKQNGKQKTELESRWGPRAVNIEYATIM